MADQKKIDKTSEAMATTYEEGITDIVQTLLDSREGLTDEEFGSTILALDMKTIVANKLSSIKTEYTKAHIDILKDTKPIGKND
jgi:hypothetical protein